MQDETPPAFDTLRIESEDEAFKVLQQALNEEFADRNVQLQFDGWPVIRLRLTGDGYDRTITAPMAEGLVALQRAMNRTYARLVRNSTNARVLTDEEKRAVQFKAKVDRGSSLVEVNLGDFAKTLADATMGRMTGTELVVMVISAAAVAGSVVAYKAYLNARSRDKKVEAEVAKSVQDTERFGMLTKALETRAELPHVAADFDDSRTELLKGVADASSIEMQGVTLTNADARVVAATPREKSVEVRLDGVYNILRIDWSKPDEARMTLMSADKQKREFTATLNTRDLVDARKEILKTAEWERRDLTFKINGTELRGEITTAHIVNVSWPKTD